jgi:two-component system, OmpR family, KDP operon response regulator KdpE
MTALLLVDDEAPFARALSISLRGSGYDVQVAATGSEGLQVAAQSPFDIVMLDLGLPDIDGIDVLRALRVWTSVPVIVLSARQDEVSIVAALDAGADDYVTKPFSMGQLLARLRAALRRVAPTADQPVVVTAHFRVDLVTHEVTGPDNQIVKLTPTEWGVLEVLVRNRGKLVTQRQMLHEVWGPQYDKETEYLRVYMGALRRKLEPIPSQPRYFITEPGMGYRFVGDAA